MSSLFKSSSSKSGRRKGVPKASPEEWTREEVGQWLEALGFERYAAVFRPIAGHRLLALARTDLLQLADTSLDADLLSDAIQDLCLRVAGAVPPPRTPPLNASVKESANGDSGNGFGMDDLSASEALAAAATQFGTTPPAGCLVESRQSSTTTGSAFPAGTMPRESPVGHLMRESNGVMDNASMLSELVGAPDGSPALFLHLSKLGISGAGLVEAAQRTPAVGHIIGALWELRDLAAVAHGNRGNCDVLDAFGADVLRSLDFHGKQLMFIDTHALDQLTEVLKRGCDIVDGCGRRGWLPRMATNEKTVDEFKSVQARALLILQEQRLATLPTGKPLAAGEYRDASRSLRRLLKQYGDGSLEKGLRFVASSSAAQSEAISLLAVDRPALKKELAAVESGADLQTLAAADGGLTAGVVGGQPTDPHVIEADVRAREAHTVFNTYDRNRSDALEMGELRACLADMDLLEGKTAWEQETLMDKWLGAADASCNGCVSYQDFVAFLPTVSTNKARQQLRATLGVEVEKELRRAFNEFSSYGTRLAATDMDGSKFFKLVKDSHLLSRGFTSIDCDLIFSKVKQKGSRRINFAQFLTALAAVAEARHLSLAEAVKKVVACGGPTTCATRADYVKFHDDKSTYTGVYARGGPTAIEESKGLATLVDRRATADVRGVKLSGSHESPAPRTPPSAPKHRPRMFHYSDMGGVVDDEELLASFRSFACFGARNVAAMASPARPVATSPACPTLEMDGSRFAKLCRETGLQAGHLNSVGTDIIFSKVKAKGTRKIGFREFLAALPLIAEDRGISVDEVRCVIASGGGPTTNGITHAAAVRFHDDHPTGRTPIKSPAR